MFITFEGGEGSGKSTQINLLSKFLLSNLYKVFVTREPGGSVGAETIRQLLVTGNPNRWDAHTEALLMYAARRDNFIRIIKPKLSEGNIVISDRFSDSTKVYQGYVGGVSDTNIDLLHKFSLDDFYPDLTFYLDLDVTKGLERANSRKSNEKRFESKGLEFHENIRKSYLKLASDEPARIYIIDASKSISKIHYEITKVVEKFLTKNK